MFFLEDHEAPVSRADDLSEYYRELNATALRLDTDFLMNVTRPEQMSHTITYANGSEVKYLEEILVDSETLKNIVTIDTRIPLFIYEQGRPGCSKWTIQFIVSDITSNPAFWLSSKVIRSQCPISVLDGEKRLQVPYIRYSLNLLPKLVVIAGLHLILSLYEIVIRWRKHIEWRVTDADYVNLKSSRQFHYTIGSWIVLEAISCVVLIAGCSVLLDDLHRVTELPTLVRLQIFAICNIVLDVTMLQFFRFHPLSYHFITILGEGVFLLLDVAIGFVPVVCAFLIAGIFIFAHIAPKTRSIFGMMEVLVSFTLGDNIQPTYDEFSDGTLLFNWMAFGYITLLVLVSGWTVFASFTAVIQFTDRKVAMKNKID
jgi:hypothetical protein